MKEEQRWAYISSSMVCSLASSSHIGAFVSRLWSRQSISCLKVCANLNTAPASIFLVDGYLMSSLEKENKCNRQAGTGKS